MGGTSKARRAASGVGVGREDLGQLMWPRLRTLSVRVLRGVVPALSLIVLGLGCGSSPVGDSGASPTSAGVPPTREAATPQPLPERPSFPASPPRSIPSPVTGDVEMFDRVRRSLGS